ncbi:MAG: hypothetical protein R6V12_09340 [Candidatus Hydrogenedentota bacterium]
MTPFLQKTLNDIVERLDALEEILASSQEQVIQADQRKQEALETQLRHRKELVTLQHKANAYDAVRAQQDQISATHQSIHQGLRQLLALTKALAAEIRQ